MVTPARVARAKVCAAETVAEHHRGRGQHPWSSCYLLVGEHALAEHHEAQMDQAPVHASAMMEGAFLTDEISVRRPYTFAAAPSSPTMDAVMLRGSIRESIETMRWPRWECS